MIKIEKSADAGSVADLFRNINLDASLPRIFMDHRKIRIDGYIFLISVLVRSGEYPYLLVKQAII